MVGKAGPGNRKPAPERGRTGRAAAPSLMIAEIEPVAEVEVVPAAGQSNTPEGDKSGLQADTSSEVSI